MKWVMGNESDFAKPKIFKKQPEQPEMATEIRHESINVQLRCNEVMLMKSLKCNAHRFRDCVDDSGEANSII